MRRTKIIATLGPAVKEDSKLKSLIKAGTDIARLNIAHGSLEEHRMMKNKFERISQQLEKNTAIMLDIKGPEVRVKDCKKRFIKKGEEISIGENGDIEFNQKIVYEHLSPGAYVLIHDGEIKLRIREIKDNLAIAEVIQGGIIAPRMGANFPSTSIPIPYIQERDIMFIRELAPIDFIAASFTRSASDIVALRKIMDELGVEAQIIAKIENQEGVKNIEEILEISDGIMVARGDLGTEIPIENLPQIQKYLLKKTIEKGKVGIIATQILESMIRNPQPTRAEVSDIANAVLDGADALMLSGETAIGKYPIEAVKVLAKVAEKSDNIVEHRGLIELKGSLSESISNAAVLLAKEINADAILVLTRTGKTARLVSRHKPPMKILAATYSEKTLQSCSVYWGVEAFLIDKFKYAEKALKNAIEKAEEMNLLKKGNVIVIAGGEPSGTPGTTNFVWLQIVGNVIARGKGYGKRRIRGKICRDVEKCDILLLSHWEDIDIKDAKGIVIESKNYEPAKLMNLSKRGISILAGTGKIKIENEIVTLDPERGVLWK